MSNKKLFYVMSALAIAIAIPLTIHSANQQTETRSMAAEPSKTIQTQTNELGTVTQSTNFDIQEKSSSYVENENLRSYLVGNSIYHGNLCVNAKWKYKVNGLTFTAPDPSQDTSVFYNLCGHARVLSSANCNTISIIPPKGMHTVGIGYMRRDKGLDTFTYEAVTAKKLCGHDYAVLFYTEPNK